jgi:hypothetical protein
MPSRSRATAYPWTAFVESPVDIDSMIGAEDPAAFELQAQVAANNRRKRAIDADSRLLQNER